MPSSSHISLGLPHAFRHGFYLNTSHVLRQCCGAQNIAPGQERPYSRVIRRPRPSGHDNIHVDSLRKTLDAHDEANQASLIRKIRAFDHYRESVIFRPSSLDYSSSKSRSPATSRKKLGPGHKKTFTVIRKAGSRKRLEGAAQLYGDWAPPRKEIKVQYPWMPFVRRNDVDGHTRLNDEILAFCEFIKPTEWERKSAIYAEKELERRIKSAAPYFTTQLVGSRASGLSHPLSDLDFCLSLSPDAPPGLDYSYPLKQILDGLKDSDDKELSAFELVKARVPILRFRHGPSGSLVEIQIGNDSNISKQYIRNYLTEFPNLRPLYALIRSALEMRGLTKVIRGGTGSYGLLMMILASLKHGNATSSKDELSKQLFYFLDMFANLNFKKTCVAVDPPELFSKHTPNAKQLAEEKKIEDRVKRGQLIISRTLTKEPYLMCLQDPANPSNDLGRRCYQIQSIQKVFGEVLQHLKREMEIWNERGPTKEHTVLGPVVGANWQNFLKERVRTSFYQENMAFRDKDSKVRLIKSDEHDQARRFWTRP